MGGIVPQCLIAVLSIVRNKIGTTALVVCLLVLFLYMSVTEALDHARSDQDVFDPGISLGSHVWCDESHWESKLSR
jgi:hypothetical protein